MGERDGETERKGHETSLMLLTCNVTCAALHRGVCHKLCLLPFQNYLNSIDEY